MFVCVCVCPCTDILHTHTHKHTNRERERGRERERVRDVRTQKHTMVFRGAATAAIDEFLLTLFFFFSFYTTGESPASRLYPMPVAALAGNILQYML